MFNLQYVTTEDVIGVKSTVSVAVLRDIAPIPMLFALDPEKICWQPLCQTQLNHLTFTKSFK